MFANLLPGFRELRAPLAAGYLFLLCAWVLFHDKVGASCPSGTAREGGATCDSRTVEALHDLGGHLGPGALAIALSFAAYLLGALWEPLALAIAQPKWRPFTYLPGDVVLARYFDDVLPLPPGIRLTKAGWEQLNTVAARLFTQVNDKLKPPQEDRAIVEYHRLLQQSRDSIVSVAHLALAQPSALDDPDRVSDAMRKAATVEARPSSSALTAAERAIARTPINSTPSYYQQARAKIITAGSRETWWLSEAPAELWVESLVPPGRMRPALIIKHPDSIGFDTIPTYTIAKHMHDELESTARYLVSEENRESYFEIGRMKAEIDFRFTVALPLVVTTIVLVSASTFPRWSMSLCFVAGVVAGFAMLADAWRRQDQRNDLLVQLLDIGQGKSPLFEQLTARVEASVAVQSAGSEADHRRRLWRK